MAKLTGKQQRFVDEYILCLNATRAALNAGYSPKTAYYSGAENLRKPQIKELLDQRRKEIREQLQQQFSLGAIKAREVMHEILTDEGAADKDKITVARDFLDRAGYKPSDKVEHSGEINNPFAGLTTEELKRLASGKSG